MPDEYISVMLTLVTLLVHVIMLVIVFFISWGLLLKATVKEDIWIDKSFESNYEKLEEGDKYTVFYRIYFDELVMGLLMVRVKIVIKKSGEIPNRYYSTTIRYFRGFLFQTRVILILAEAKALFKNSEKKSRVINSFKVKGSK